MKFIVSRRLGVGLVGLFLLACLTANQAFAQFATPVLNGNITAAEYSNNNSGPWYMTWDDTYLYIAKTGGAANEPVYIYLDIDPRYVATGGNNTNGNLVGTIDFGTRPNLPFRGDARIYWQASSNYIEFKSRDGSGDWTAPNTNNGDISQASTGTNREMRIRWAALPGLTGRPSSFLWFGYEASLSSPYFVYDQIPSANYSGNTTANPNFRYFLTVASTVNGASSNPFAQVNYVMTVNSTNDSVDANLGDFRCNTSVVNECTLRAALQELATTTQGVGLISFDITGTKTITTASALLPINKPVVVDATTQPGFGGCNVNALSNNVVLKGNGGAFNGLSFNNVMSSTLKGLSIIGFGQDGLLLNTVTNTNVICNFIGSATFPNGLNGIRINSGTSNIINGNNISFNARNGILLAGDTQRNTLSTNRITSNNELGIDLNSDGVSPNDIGDGDVGANGLQNYPVLSAATVLSTSVLLSGSLNSKPNTAYSLEFFQNGVCDTSGYGEGSTYLGNQVVTTDGSGNANFTVNLNGVGQGQFLTATATDPLGNTSEFSQCRAVPIQASISDASVVETNSGSTNLVFTVTLAMTSSTPISVNYTIADGTATAPADYASGSGTLVFAAGQTSKTISVIVNGDTLYEADETITVSLSSSDQVTLVDGEAVGTILNDDALPALSVTDVSVLEGNSGTTSLVFTASLNAASGVSATINYTTNDGTAQAGSDYVTSMGAITFAPGETSKVFTVTVNGDTFYEADETFTIVISSNDDVELDESEIVGTIVNDDAAPTLSIANANVVEGNSGTTSLVFTVSLNITSTLSATVTYSTTDGTAQSGSDYIGTTGLLTFAAGETSKNITVTVNGDTTFEANETFSVVLSNPTNATLANPNGVGTINNDDIAPTISISDTSVIEGNIGTSSAVFTVTLTGATEVPASAFYVTTAGSAQATIDFIPVLFGSITFPAGVSSQVITIPVVSETLFEDDETFAISLLIFPGNTSAIIGRGTGTATIINDDAPPSISVNDASIIEGNGGTSSLVFTATLSAASSLTATVVYSTVNGTAQAGSDYVGRIGTLTFAPGTISQTVAITINGDTLFEPNETFQLILSGVTSATLNTTSATGVIINDDTLSNLSIANASIIEGNSGSASLLFTVTLQPASNNFITVNYSTTNGTAQAGIDYLAESGVLTFTQGITTQVIMVKVNGDTIFEPNETFTVTLSNATNAGITVGSAIGTIINDDVQPSLAIADNSFLEGNSGSTTRLFTVTLSSANGVTTTVNYATIGGTAQAGSDYNSANGTLTFAPGVISQTISVTINGDTAYEFDEIFSVNLSGATNATISTATAIGIIINDDELPILAITNASGVEGNSGTSILSFTVALNVSSAVTATVNYSTTNLTAQAGSDYVGASGMLTFTPGLTSRVISVTVLGDTLFEADETFQVVLSSPSDATLGTSTATGTILNDDTQGSFSIANSSVLEGNAGNTPLVFTVTLSQVSLVTATVDYTTTNATAAEGSDYLATGGTLTFAPGITTQLITVTVLGDTNIELNETFSVTLSNPTNATISTIMAIGTILNDDTVVCDASLVTSNTDTGSGLVCGTLSYAITQANLLPITSNRVISFSTAISQITLSGALPAPTANITIRGRCGSNGPEIMLNGTGLLELNGSVRLEGLHFAGVRLIARTTAGRNELSCVRISR